MKRSKNVNSDVISTSHHYKSDYKPDTIVSVEYHDTSARTIFGVVFLMLFIVNFFYSATSNTTPFSFTTLLYAFQEAPQIPIDWIKKFANLQITSDWSVAFNWLRDFLNNYVMKIITAGLFLCTGIVQLITYAVYFIGILFGAGVGV